MADSLKVLDELGDEFEHLAYSAAARTVRGRWRPRRRAAMLALVLTAGLSGVAVGASGLLEGEPVKNPEGVTFAPDRGLGVPQPGSVRLSSLRVDDPAGGPPWGLRTLRTSRGFGCVQVGRVVNGELGVLGQDGAFANDGRFHPLPADVLTRSYCERPDGAGQLYLAVSYRGLPAGGLATGCAVQRSPDPRPPGAHTPARANLPLCARENLRIMYFGLLGADARSVTYRTAGRSETASTVGRDGAYLVVTQPDASRPADGQFVRTVSPGSGLRSVGYSTAPTCRIPTPRALGGARLCPRVGYVDPNRPRLTTADVAAPVRARLTGNRLSVSFRARVNGDTSSTYLVGVQPERIRDCGFAAISGAVDRNVRAGEVVTHTMVIPSRCRGRLHGRVVVHRADGTGGRATTPPTPPGRRSNDPLVGRFTVELK